MKTRKYIDRNKSYVYRSGMQHSRASAADKLILCNTGIILTIGRKIGFAKKKIRDTKIINVVGKNARTSRPIFMPKKKKKPLFGKTADPSQYELHKRKEVALFFYKMKGKEMLEGFEFE